MVLITCCCERKGQRDATEEHRQSVAHTSRLAGQMHKGIQSAGIGTANPHRIRLRGCCLACVQKVVQDFHTTNQAMMSIVGRSSDFGVSRSVRLPVKRVDSGMM
jgi:hypothetical protein